MLVGLSAQAQNSFLVPLFTEDVIESPAFNDADIAKILGYNPNTLFVKFGDGWMRMTSDDSTMVPQVSQAVKKNIKVAIKNGEYAIFVYKKNKILDSGQVHHCTREEEAFIEKMIYELHIFE